MSAAFRFAVPLSLLLTFAITGAACEEPSQEGPPVAAAAPDAGAAIARVVEMEGDVKLTRHSDTRTMGLEPLRDGDLLQTGADSGALVELFDGRRIEVGPEAHVVFRMESGRVLLEVARGLLIAHGGGADAGVASPQQLSELRIVTPFGDTRVRQLAALSLDVGEESQEVDVTFGAVLHTATNGKPVEITMGQVARITRADTTVTDKPRVLLEPMSIVLSAEGAKVELREGAQGKWRRISADRGLEAGDGVRVKSGRSRVKLRGSGGLSLLAGSEVEWGMSSAGEGVVALRLQLKRGSVSLDAAEPTRLDLAGGTEVKTDDAAQVTISRRGKALEVAATTGDAQVTTSSGSTRLRAGEVAQVTAQGTVSVTAASRAAVALPSRLGLRVFHPGIREVALTWEGSQQDDHLVEVAADSSFAALVAKGRVHGTFINVPAPRKGALHWRVRSADGGRLLDKGSATFAGEPPPRRQGGLENEVRDGAEHTTIYFQDELPAITFTFRRTEVAARYKVTVYRKGALDRPLVEQTVAATAAPLKRGALAEGSYLWTVTPLSDSGQPLRGGKMNKLEIIFDNSVTTTVITAPKNGVRFGPRVVASGVVPVGAKVVVNGRPAPLDDKHRFEVTVAPWGPPPLVVFRQQHQGSADVFIVRVGKRGK